jgi:hypothetical protein
LLQSSIDLPAIFMNLQSIFRQSFFLSSVILVDAFAARILWLRHGAECPFCSDDFLCTWLTEILNISTDGVARLSLRLIGIHAIVEMCSKLKGSGGRSERLSSGFKRTGGGEMRATAEISTGPASKDCRLWEEIRSGEQCTYRFGNSDRDC